MKHLCLVVDPREYLSLSSYGFLKDHMSYPTAVKILFTALEYRLYVGDEYLYELDSLVYDELGFLDRSGIAVDMITALFDVLVKKNAQRVRMLLDPYLANNRGWVFSISFLRPFVVRLEITFRDEFHEPPAAYITHVLRRRINEVVHENPSLCHSDLQRLISGLAPSKEKR